MSAVLGLNEFFHDTAAALVVDGRLVAAIEQERLDRRKHATGFALRGDPPWAAIDWCLEQAGLRYRDVDAIAVSFDADALRSLRILADLVRGNRKRSHLGQTLRNRTRLSDPALDFVAGLTLGTLHRRAFLRRLESRCKAPVEVIHHHLAHAASAYFPSGMDEAAVVVLDGMGDATPTSLWEGRDGRLRMMELEPDPEQSLGILYRTITLALGFTFMDAGKTMGLAAYGTSRPEMERMLRVEPDGRYRIDWPLVRQLAREHARFSGDLQEVHKDLAASLQSQLEWAGVALAHRALDRASAREICLAGGVALNCNMNARILASSRVDGLYVQPGAMDMGCAVGAAIQGVVQRGDRYRGGFSVYCGPEYDAERIERALRSAGVRYRAVDDPAVEAAERLARREIVAWFQGPMEFGPRALGARSFLANPDRLETRDRVNRLKGREAWRPLAPAVLESSLDDWFIGAAPSPHMTLTFHFRPECRARIPAVVHADGSARVQSVDPDAHPAFASLIRAFEARTGLPMVLNTSFNRRGEPIVDTPEQALDTFAACRLDALVIGPFVVEPPGGAAP